ncbi:MAG: hypothetical protein IIV99_00005, partial [Oscillospiraceae bacterium]|nr:hypothetical protein [Oscillospiraceae bacterium]
CHRQVSIPHFLKNNAPLYAVRYFFISLLGIFNILSQIFALSIFFIPFHRGNLWYSTNQLKRIAGQGLGSCHPRLHKLMDLSF